MSRMEKQLLSAAVLFVATSLVAAPQDQPDPNWSTSPREAQKLTSNRNASSATMSFEVASVTECRDNIRTGLKASPGRLSMTCWPLRRLIEDAYEVFASGKVDPLNPIFPYMPIEGIPNWVNLTKYSIVAKADAPQTLAVMRGPMMQVLLQDRFHLSVHRETREVPVYLMTIGEGGPRLATTKEGSCKPLDPTDLDQKIPTDIPFCIVTPPMRKGCGIL